MNRARTGLLTLVALLALPAQAGSGKVSVLRFSGPKAAFVREQLLASLCDWVSCVSPNQVSGGSRTDWGRVREQSVNGVITGAVVKARGKKTLKLALLSGPRHTAWSRVVALDRRGELAPKEERSVSIALEKVVRQMERAASAPPAEPEPDAASAGGPKGKKVVAQASAPEPKPEPEARSEAARPERHDPDHYQPLPPEMLSSTPRI